MADPHVSTLLERDRHLEVLAAAAASVRADKRGRLLLIGGEGGAGKTVLVRAFCEQRHRAERVLWGGCDALFTPRPLGPFLDIAHALGGELATVLDAGAKPHEVARSLLAAVDRHGPTIVVVEDLHWADEASLDVVRLLARPVEQVPVLVIATYRNDELDRVHPLRVVLGELRSARTAERLDVEPLTLPAVETLASAHDVDAAALFRATGGNPFFVTEVLAAASGAIPETVRDAVLSRAARLDATARTVLDAVAVVPQQAELWLLEALAGADVAGLDACIATGMLLATPDGVAFRHELARRAVEESLPPLRAKVLHERALSALAAPPGGVPDVTRLAHHADAAGDAGAVLTYAPAAATLAISLGAHREAAAQYERALRFAAADAHDVRASLLENLSQEYYFIDRIDKAIEALEAALGHRRATSDTRGEAAALCALSRRFWCSGNRQASESAGRSAVDLLEGLPPGRELALAYGNLSQLAMNAEDAEAAIAWGERAVALGESIGDTEIVVHSLNNIGTMQLLGGGGAATLQRSLALAEEAGLDEHVGRAFIHLGWGITRTRAYDLAPIFDVGVQSCSDRGLELWRLYVIAFRARHDLDQGRWTKAADAAAEILRYERSAPLARILALSLIGVVRARRGDPHVWDALDEAEATLAGAADLQWFAPVALARGEAAWLEGHGPEAVAASTQRALDLAVLRDAPWVTGELLTWRRYAGVEESPDVASAPVAEPYARQLAGDWGGAAAYWAAIGCRYEAALALGQSEDADDVRRGLDALQRLGARRTAAVVARRLRERGVKDVPRGPRATTQANPANLTARELGVLELVAQGLPNSEIAARLFLSTKTVDKHVSAALRKLGARSRAEASAQAVRLGIVTADPALTR